MSLSGNFRLPFSESTDLASVATSPFALLPALGVELLFTQDASGRYLSFYWRETALQDLTPEQVGQTPLGEKFGPVERVPYLERVQRVLTSFVPERCCCLFSYAQQFFLFELVISPILPPKGEATVVLVMGRVLEATGETTSSANDVTQLLALRSIQSKKLLTQIAQNIRRTLDLNTIWQQTVDSLGEALGANRCVIYPYKLDCLQITVAAEYLQAPFRSMLGLELAVANQPSLSQALKTREPVVVDQTQHPNFQQQSVLVVATCYQDQPNGLISLHQCDCSRQWKGVAT